MSTHRLFTNASIVLLGSVVVATVSLASCGDPHSDFVTTEGGSSTSEESTGTSGSTVTYTVTSDGSSSPTTSTGTTSATTGDEEPEQPTVFCPGDPSGMCDEVAGARLRAGAGVVSIIPNCFETWDDLNNDFKYFYSQDKFHDCGCDKLCPGDPGYTSKDKGEGDGVFQAAWMAGFGNGRAAKSVRRGTDGWFGGDDGLWARAVVVEQGNTTVAIVALDVVGWFNDDVKRIRQMLAQKQLGVDYLLVHSTHNHEGPDTMGLWGEQLVVSGYNEEYSQQVREAVVQAIEISLSDAREVDYMVVGKVDVGTSFDAGKGVANVIRDSRDPVIIDEALSAARLVDTGGQTIATLVNFSSHPETLADDNLYLTSDYVHALRRTVEHGSQWFEAEGKEGFGGVCVFLNGAVGGMMTTLGVQVTTPDDMSFSSASFEKADAIGQLLGEKAIEAINNGSTDSDPRLEFAAEEFTAELENVALRLMYEQGIIDRTICKHGPQELEGLCTEMAMIRLGPIDMLSVPGELLPELAIGGYDQSHVGSTLYEFIDPQNPDPPDIGSSPDGPYLKTLMGREHAWIIGLGNDEVGYIVPEYDFKLAEGNPYIDEAPGDHYEETNSLGPKTAGLIDDMAGKLTQWMNGSS